MENDIFKGEPYDTNQIRKISKRRHQTAIFPHHHRESRLRLSGGGRTLDQKIQTIDGNFSDAFDETKAYATGDYCIYLNQLYKFTSAKSAGAFDGTKVVPVNLGEFMRRMENRYVERSTGTVDSVLGQYADVLTFTVPPNKRCLIFAGLEVTASFPEVINIRLAHVTGSGKYKLWYNGITAKAPGTTGGGVSAIGYIETENETPTIAVRSYGYSTVSYQYVATRIVIEI